MGGMLPLVHRGEAGWGPAAPPNPLIAVPNVTPTHQRPVYYFILFDVAL